jgi:hypothetical protein
MHIQVVERNNTRYLLLNEGPNSLSIVRAGRTEARLAAGEAL